MTSTSTAFGTPESAGVVTPTDRQLGAPADVVS